MTTTADDDRRTADRATQAVLGRSALVVLGLRALMEMGIVLGFGYWGYATGDSTPKKLALAIGTPLVGFGFWGLVDFHQAGRAAEGLRLAQELLVSGIAAAALWTAGLPVPGLVLAVLSLGYHVLVYATGGRLLKPRR